MLRLLDPLHGIRGGSSFCFKLFTCPPQLNRGFYYACSAQKNMAPPKGDAILSRLNKIISSLSVIPVAVLPNYRDVLFDRQSAFAVHQGDLSAVYFP